MTNPVVQPQSVTTRQIRWGRIVIGAVLIEAALMAIAVPLFAAVDNPFAGGAQGAAGDFTIFFVCIAAACLGIGALFGAWVARPLSPRLKERRRGVPVDRVLHGALTGIVATAIYLAICSIPPTTIAAVMAAYGPFWFFVANGLRIAGSMLGAAYQGRP